MTSLPNTWTFRRVKHKETLTIICGGGLSRTGGPLLDILHMATRLRFRHCPGEESGEVNRFSFGRKMFPLRPQNYQFSNTKHTRSEHPPTNPVPRVRYHYTEERRRESPSFDTSQKPSVTPRSRCRGCPCAKHKEQQVKTRSHHGLRQRRRNQ
ncbi:hypothetical protein TNIN_59551 [Trichonephila inaurata madagascariensis]|uniref:Uncharacterized protein n=1 Tax=Trichonephila inaurata madagascariensis TaxID=2747483 RepID=A0A8X6XG17_9ARAC|nr:hypothetical protein TNIN_59551 [Trichonephila inaurata madagascariensis]